MGISSFCPGLVLVLMFFSVLPTALTLGHMSSIAASFGEEPMFCSIQATNDQEIQCWWANSTATMMLDSTSASAISLAGISGGWGSMCGLRAGTFKPFCWKNNLTSQNTVPALYQNSSYTYIAAGEQHFCAVRINDGKLDCWGDQNLMPGDGEDSESVEMVVAARYFSCVILTSNYGARCWGDNAPQPPQDAQFEMLSAGSWHVCGILKGSRQARCWGDDTLGQSSPPNNVTFVLLSAGHDHSCGIREHNHEIICWGKFNQSSVPVKSDFLALASADVTCGIRETNLLVDCFGNGTQFEPPPQLFSPGVCTAIPCEQGQYKFNASSFGIYTPHNSLCVVPSQEICIPCAQACPNGMFLSSPCSNNQDRICNDCELCQTEDVCKESCAFSPVGSFVGTRSASKKGVNVNLILGTALSVVFLITMLCGLWGFLSWKGRQRYSLSRRLKRSSLSNGSSNLSQLSSSSLLNSGPLGRKNSSSLSNSGPLLRKNSYEAAYSLQAFRLADLRDATNGFKELNELGRGSYGFVYKAVLQDGRQVAVKRANAARRLRGNSRDFETELEILCKIRHSNLVNLIGYCGEMGERLLVYEFMPHGTLHDHLHGGLMPLGWGLRLRMAAQAAIGIEYLHKDASPKVVHGNIKSSNILLDGEWFGRVADFCLCVSGDKDRAVTLPLDPTEVGYIDPDYYQSQVFTEKSDVYSFGVVLLEILSGRKAFDSGFNPSHIVEWAAPLISDGKTVSMIDRTLELPKNMDALLKLAEIAQLCVRSKPNERPSMSDVVSCLEHIANISGLL